MPTLHSRRIIWEVFKASDLGCPKQLKKKQFVSFYPSNKKLSLLSLPQAKAILLLSWDTLYLDAEFETRYTNYLLINRRKRNWLRNIICQRVEALLWVIGLLNHVYGRQSSHGNELDQFVIEQTTITNGWWHIKWYHF